MTVERRLLSTLIVVSLLFFVEVVVAWNANVIPTTSSSSRHEESLSSSCWHHHHPSSSTCLAMVATAEENEEQELVAAEIAAAKDASAARIETASQSIDDITNAFLDHDSNIDVDDFLAAIEQEVDKIEESTGDSPRPPRQRQQADQVVMAAARGGAAAVLKGITAVAQETTNLLDSNGLALPSSDAKVGEHLENSPTYGEAIDKVGKGAKGMWALASAFGGFVKDSVEQEVETRQAELEAARLARQAEAEQARLLKELQEAGAIKKETDEDLMPRKTYAVNGEYGQEEMRYEIFEQEQEERFNDIMQKASNLLSSSLNSLQSNKREELDTSMASQYDDNVEELTTSDDDGEDENNKPNMPFFLRRSKSSDW